MGQKDKSPLTVNWDSNLLAFVKGPLFDKISVKPGRLTELAMEQYLKDNGHWEDYQQFLTENEIL